MSSGEIILYNTEDGQARIRLRADDGTVWLSQAEIAELFQTTPQNITQHISVIYDEREQDEATCKESLQVQTEGQRQVKRSIRVYRLEMILAVGFRVRSSRGAQFRRWATEVLQQYLVKGFSIDDERLKEPAGGWDYFDELLEQIRAIRASEKRFYQKVRDLFATSADYDGGTSTAQVFFQTIQNKLLWAITQNTAAELIVARADEALSNMGLTTWQGSRVRKQDIGTAKNYLNKTECRELDRLVSAFLDLAEDRAQNRQQTTMVDWTGFVDRFLILAERPLLKGAGRISHEQMVAIVGERYATFDNARRKSEQDTAEAEYEDDVATELGKIEQQVVVRKKRGR